MLIKDCLEVLKNPYRVLAKKIPKFLKKIDIERMFQKFGEIESLKIIDSPNNKYLFAYVNFTDSTSAKNCCERRFLQEKGLRNVQLFYSVPIFNEDILHGFHPKVQDYLIKVQNEQLSFDPEKFYMIEKEVSIEKLIKKSMKKEIKNTFQAKINNPNHITNLIQTNIYPINRTHVNENLNLERNILSLTFVHYFHT